MHSMCVDRQEKMEEVFENITVPYLATLAAKFGKDKILQVSSLYAKDYIVCNYVL